MPTFILQVSAFIFLRQKPRLIRSYPTNKAALQTQMQDRFIYSIYQVAYVYKDSVYGNPPKQPFS